MTTVFQWGKECDDIQGFIDVMTMKEVVKPTISPYGHVLGYDTWMHVLNGQPKNTCPFTKQVGFGDEWDIEIDAKTTCQTECDEH